MKRSGIPQFQPRTSTSTAPPPPQTPQTPLQNNEQQQAESQSKDKSSKKTDKKKVIEFVLPPLSIMGKKKEIDFEMIRKKVMLRGNPEGEDKKELAAILKHLKDSKAKIRVHEFVSLVSKFTCDNGETMRKVMEDDLASFRRTATKVYETMTQDVSDVLINEQIQTAEFYQERYNMYNAKMLWMITQIYQMIPEFDFARYVQDKDQYLRQVCPMPEKLKRDEEDVDLQKRQEAFHRLQWLKIEEGRLAEENRRLEDRLEELKRRSKRDNTEASMKSMIMEQKMHDLIEEEVEKQEHLNELENVLGRNIVRAEAYVRLEEDETIRLTKPLPREESSKKKRTGTTHDEEDWSATTARGIEQDASRRLMLADRAVADERKRIRRKNREPGREMAFFTDEPPEPVEYFELPSAQFMDQRDTQEHSALIQERRPKRPSPELNKSACRGGCSPDR